MNGVDIHDVYALLTKYTPNHMNHFLISFLTIGIWVPVWLLYTALLCERRNRILRVHDLQTEFNVAGVIILSLCTGLFALIPMVLLHIFGFNN